MHTCLKVGDNNQNNSLQAPNLHKKQCREVRVADAKMQCTNENTYFTPLSCFFAGGVLGGDLFVEVVAPHLSSHTIRVVAIACKKGSAYMKKFRSKNDEHIHDLCFNEYFHCRSEQHGFIPACMRCYVMHCECAHAINHRCIPDLYRSLVEDIGETWSVEDYKCKTQCASNTFVANDYFGDY